MFTPKVAYTIPDTDIECLMSPITFGEAEAVSGGELDMTGAEFLLAHFWEKENPNNPLFTAGSEKEMSPRQMAKMSEDLAELSGTGESGDEPHRFPGDAEGGAAPSTSDGEGIREAAE